MNDPNSAINRTKRNLLSRWSIEDYPGSDPRISIGAFAKDFATFLLIPAFVAIVIKSCEGTSSATRKPNQSVKRDITKLDGTKSQIIDFTGTIKSGGKADSNAYFGVSKKAPGTLVRLKLLNVVETYQTAPVHAQVVDQGIGNNLIGGTFIGDANPDTAFERINISFKFVRDPSRDNIAVPISARALSLNGTLGLDATKKEGFFARSVFNSATNSANEAQGKMGSGVDFKEVLFRALTAGLVQEFGAGSQVEKNKSQVLTLQPSTEFFAELTDFFPGGSK